jgi:nitrite reductase/ring-hydroxylating ferredoxin subunit
MNNLEKGTSRRQFLRYVGSFFASGLVISTVYPILTSCEKDESLPAPPPGSSITINLKDYPELGTIKSIKKIAFQNPINTILIIKRETEDIFIVFSAFCPHQGVELETPSNPDGNIKCSRHFVEFSTNLNTKGNVVANPQGVKLGNLPTYQAEFDKGKNILTIKLS